MSEDTISRQAVIEINRSYHGQMPNEVNHRIWKEINELPSAQPEPQWIPCNERLPDKPNVYTVTDHDGRVVRYVYNDNEFSREYWKRCAKAWMPLPEPYKEWGAV